MRNIKRITAVCVLIALWKTSTLQAQQEKRAIYRDVYNGKLMTESEYSVMKNKFQKEMKNTNKSGKLVEVIVDSITSEIIYKNFDLSYVTETVANEVEHIEDFLNKKFPSTELILLNSQKIKFDDLKGKPTLVNFWFTQCAPCIKEIPALESLKKKYGEKVNFVAITFNNAKEVKAFLEKREFNYTHIVDVYEFINEIGLNTYPRNIILDKEGLVRSIKGEISSKKVIKNNRQTFRFDTSTLEKELDRLL